MKLVTCSGCGQQNPVDARFCSCCGADLPELNTSHAELRAGTKLRDRYIIRYPLGQGGFGKAYLAVDTGRFNELVVLKELTPSNQGTFALQKVEELFQREAEMLHKLVSPQIPRFWEFFREERRLFLVQDYVEGKTYQTLLEERLAEGRTFSETEVIQLMRQLLPVLSYLHSLGIIHRDISPDNIICRAQDNLPVLIDLGGVKQMALAGAQVADSPFTSSSGGTRLGKIGYAPDEQLRLGIAAPHSDLYALGVTVLVLLSGKPPQELIDLQTMEWDWEQHLPHLNPTFNAILHRILATQPIDRFQSADELLRQLDSTSTVPPTQLYNHAARQPPVVTQSQAGFSETLANSSGQGPVFDSSVKVPEEIQGWNWGAFFLPGFWCLTNQVWIGLISWADLSIVTIPFTLGTTWPIMSVVLGIKGSEWAWKSRRWKSIKDFKRHQRMWAIAGFLITGVVLALTGLVVLVLGWGLSSIGGGGMGGMGGGD